MKIIHKKINIVYEEGNKILKKYGKDYKNKNKEIYFYKLFGNILKQIIPKFLGFKNNTLVLEKIVGELASESIYIDFILFGKFLKDIHNKLSIFNISHIIENNNELFVENAVFNNEKKFYKNEFIKFYGINYNINDIVLSHGDYTLTNIIIKNNGKMTLVDFEYMNLRDKYYDIAHIYGKICKTQKNKTDFLKGYGYIDFKKLDIFIKNKYD